MCPGDPATDRITKEIRDKHERQDRDTSSWMGMLYVASWISIWETEKDLHWGTDPPAFRYSQANYFPNRHKWICDCRLSQPIWCLSDSQAGQFQPLEMLFCWTALWHLWLEVIGQNGNSKTVMELPQVLQFCRLNLVRLQDYWIHHDVHIALPKSSQLIWNLFSLWLYLYTPRHAARTLPMARPDSPTTGTSTSG